jgi:amino acid transporter
MALLRRDLGFWGTASLSVGGMAPTLAMSVTGVQAARLLGPSAPLAYILAGVGMVFIGYGFVRLSAAFSHAGSVYAFVGRTLGPRVGFFTTWALLGTYIVFPPVSVFGVAAFTQALFRHAEISRSVDWLPIALVAWAVIWLLASRGIKLTARSVILVELVSLALIAALVVVIYVRLGMGDAPGRQKLTADVFKIPAGTGFATVALAATFGILSYGGFESAMSAGEESHRPRRIIPGSIIAAVVFGALFYTACIAAQSMGFGATTAGAMRFANSAAPLGDLATAYAGSTMADFLDVAAVLSALGAALVGVAVASRTVFEVSGHTGTPAAAVTASMALTLVALLAFGLAGTSALNAFFYLATIGTLSLLVVYILVSVSAFRLIAAGLVRASKVELILPIGGVVVAGYVLYRNLVPAPASPFDVFPYIVAAWLLVGLAIALAVPGLARRISERLALR